MPGKVSLRVILILAVALLSAVTGCRWQEAEYVVLPDGFSGWVLIEYSVPDAPALPQADGHF